ncbi:MAG: hypothetical protein KGN30_04405, partial [Nitrospirota bacterium]|nr:hypothetical protein [Nitrospirota bacterium]
MKTFKMLVLRYAWHSLFCILTFNIWGCAGIQYSDRVQAVDLTQIDKKEATVRVLAIADEWRNSGVIV